MQLDAAVDCSLSDYDRKRTLQRKKKKIREIVS